MCASAEGAGPRIDDCAVEVSAGGDRQSVEALYLDLRHLAKQHGLKIEFQLRQENPADPSAR